MELIINVLFKNASSNGKLEWRPRKTEVDLIVVFFLVFENAIVLVLYLVEIA